MTILATAQEAGGYGTSQQIKTLQGQDDIATAGLGAVKTAVLHSLGAASSQESYRHAIDEFIGWIAPNRG